MIAGASATLGAPVRCFAAGDLNNSSTPFLYAGIVSIHKVEKTAAITDHASYACRSVTPRNCHARASPGQVNADGIGNLGSG